MIQTEKPQKENKLEQTIRKTPKKPKVRHPKNYNNLGYDTCCYFNKNTEEKFETAYLMTHPDDGEQTLNGIRTAPPY